MTTNLAYLGVLSATTSQGRRAVAVATVGAVELHHLVSAGFVPGSKVVEQWLLTAGINPAESYSSLPPERMVEDVLVPAIGDRVLVVAHSDLDVPLVSMLVSRMARMANPAIVSGIPIEGPLAHAVNGAAGRRAFALMANYEAALERSRSAPLEHVVDGRLDVSGVLRNIEVDGPFAKEAWTLEDADDGLFAMLTLAGLGKAAFFTVKDGPAAAEISRLLGEVGLAGRLAA